MQSADTFAINVIVAMKKQLNSFGAADRLGSEKNVIVSDVIRVEWYIKINGIPISVDKEQLQERNRRVHVFKERKKMLKSTIKFLSRSSHVGYLLSVCLSAPTMDGESHAKLEIAPGLPANSSNVR